MQTPSPTPLIPTPEEPLPVIADIADGETVYLETLAREVRRVSQGVALVRRPGVDVIHELKNTISPGPPQSIRVLVTSRRVVLGSKTYLTRELTSVEMVNHAKSVGCALILMGLGAMTLLMLMCTVFSSPFGTGGSGRWMFFYALMFLIAGYLVYRSAKDSLAVHLTASSGEVDGLMSVNQNTIAQIHEALQKALLEKE